MSSPMYNTAHFPIPVNARGDGPVDPESFEYVRDVCACGVADWPCRIYDALVYIEAYHKTTHPDDPADQELTAVEKILRRDDA